MVWCYFPANGSGRLHFIEGRMTGKMYRHSSTIYQDDEDETRVDSDPRHTAKETLNWFQREKKIKLLECLSQSPDLNQVENVWNAFKSSKI